MPVLENARQERFAQAIAAGKTATEAYADAGYKPNRHNAAALTRQQHISTRVAELQAERAAEAEEARREAVKAEAITMESHLARLRELSAAAQEASDFKAAIQAEVKRGEAAGFYVQRVESTNRNFVVGATPEPMDTDEWRQKHAPN